MNPLPPEQGGLSAGESLYQGVAVEETPYDLVHQGEDGSWYFEVEQGGEVNGPYLSEIGAREGLKAHQAAAEVLRPKPIPAALEQIDDDTFALDPEAAEHSLSHAAQDLVSAAIAITRNSKSDVIVDRGDMGKLRAAVKEFDLAYAAVVTVGKLMALAEQAGPQQAPAGEEVVDATYGEVPQEKLDERYERMLAEREAEDERRALLDELNVESEEAHEDALLELQAQAAEWPLPPENCPAPGPRPGAAQRLAQLRHDRSVQAFHYGEDSRRVQELDDEIVALSRAAAAVEGQAPGAEWPRDDDWSGTPAAAPEPPVTEEEK